ncbi:ester cyclase [Amycolatopsis suaedae]|uniref:Nuclear transport factor 2 family protein n=1 Tax=Amycolatopsis suaedae TaxID=2510978 RepID=A0A4Q7J815_9PSEU|nr:nuclear transport factor 2 family protein [Amycolatopsis suaedae]
MTYADWLDKLWNGDLDRLEDLAAEVVSADFTGTWPGRPGFVTGPGELAAVIREGRTMFDELRFEVEVGPLADGDLVAARWVGRGRYQGEPVEFRGHDLLRRDGGRFVEYWVIAEDPVQRPTA